MSVQDFYRKKFEEMIKHADRSHLEPPPRANKTNWNLANCASRCTTSALFDDMTWKEYCRKIQADNKLCIAEYRKLKLNS